MRECCSNTSARPVFLHLHGRTPLPSTNSQPVPPQEAHGTGFKFAASGNIRLLFDYLHCDDLPERGALAINRAALYGHAHEKSMAISHADDQIFVVFLMRALAALINATSGAARVSAPLKSTLRPPLPARARRPFQRPPWDNRAPAA